MNTSDTKKGSTKLEESYKPTVMFFRLKNSLAISQKMINDILRDLVDISNIADFTDNIIVVVYSKKEHTEKNE